MLQEFQTLFLGLANVMDSVYRGWVGRRGRVGSRRWALPYIWTETQPLCAHWSAQTATVHLSGRHSRWQQFDTKCGLISAPHARGTTHSIEDFHEFTGSQKWCRWKKTWLFVALPLVCLDSAGVWLSCQAIIWISALAGLFWVFAQVTYACVAIPGKSLLSML